MCFSSLHFKFLYSGVGSLNSIRKRVPTNDSLFNYFRTPCRTGVCESPLEVMVGQLSVSFPIIPEEMLVGVLFPGSITRSFIRSIKTNQPFSLPEYDDVVKEYNLDHFKSVTPVSEFRMEVN